MKSKTYILYIVSYERMWENTVEPDSPTDDNMVHVHCMLDTYDYGHTLTMDNT